MNGMKSQTSSQGHKDFELWPKNTWLGKASHSSIGQKNGGKGKSKKSSLQCTFFFILKFSPHGTLRTSIKIFDK